ncbi:MAG: type II toxin-antitoxin system RelE/ParE family toxin [Bacteroidota bacterium]
MAKQIIWSLQAQKDRKEILLYWRIRNQSTTYSKKLNQLFKKAVQLLAEHPHIGRRTETCERLSYCLQRNRDPCRDTYYLG